MALRPESPPTGRACWAREVEGPTVARRCLPLGGGRFLPPEPWGRPEPATAPTRVLGLGLSWAFSSYLHFSPQTFLGGGGLGQHRALQAHVGHAGAVRLQSTGSRAHLVVGVQAASGGRALEVSRGEVLPEEEGG